MGKLVAVVGY